MKICFFGKPKSIIFVLLTLIAINFSVFIQPVSAENFDDDEFQIFQLVNSERYKNQLNNLEWDDKLAKIAREYSQTMARENFLEHTDAQGKTVVDRAKDQRLGNWRKIGENLFFCRGITKFDTIAVKGWMKSMTHRQNILDKSWTATGIGIAQSRDGSIYITQVFLAD